MDEAEEVDVAPVVAGGDATEVFELVEASLDAVASFVENGIVRDRGFARAAGWDDGLHAGLRDDRAHLVGVIALVGDHAATLYRVEQRRHGNDIVRLARGRLSFALRSGAALFHRGPDFRGAGVPDRGFLIVVLSRLERLLRFRSFR